MGVELGGGVQSSHTGGSVGGSVGVGGGVSVGGGTVPPPPPFCAGGGESGVIRSMNQSHTAWHPLEHPASIIAKSNKMRKTCVFNAFCPCLRRGSIVISASGPRITPIGFHGTYGLTPLGVFLRVRKRPVSGSKYCPLPT